MTHVKLACYWRSTNFLRAGHKARTYVTSALQGVNSMDEDGKEKMGESVGQKKSGVFILPEGAGPPPWPRYC